MMKAITDLKPGYKLNVNYNELFKTWAKPLNKLLNSNYMTNLMSFLHEGYKLKSFLPLKSDIFKPFVETDYSNLRVVILAGDEPYHNDKNLGRPYAQSENQLIFDQEIIEMAMRAEEQSEEGLIVSPKYDLSHWGKQGVLALYTSPTVEQFSKGSHDYYWREFIRQLVMTINNEKFSIIFMLWGEKAKYFKQFISEDEHYILEGDSLTESVLRKRKWNNNNFKQCNEILTKLNGPDCQINWM